MGKIKVLQFPIANARGGITQYALNNWKFINKQKFQFDFATLSKELDFSQELVESGSKIHFISCYAEDNKKQFIKEIEQILEEKYDVIHLHTSYWKSFLMEEIALRYKVPKIIVHSHNTMVDLVDTAEREKAVRTHNLQRRKFSTNLATDFCACSQLAADWLFGSRIPKDRIKILKNAIDVSQFSYNEDLRSKYRKILGLENCFVMGHIGRFVYQKNHEMLIDIFNTVCHIIPNARLILVGTGVLEKTIRYKVQQYGIEDKVHFLGKRNDINFLLQAMDLFLLPSRFEGLPIVLVEAQASGVKCLTSIEVTNEVEITKNIDFLPLDINKWSEMIIQSSKGYNRIKVDKIVTKAGYNINFQIEELEKLYLGDFV